MQVRQCLTNGTVLMDLTVNHFHSLVLNTYTSAVLHVYNLCTTSPWMAQCDCQTNSVWLLTFGGIFIFDV